MKIEIMEQDHLPGIALLEQACFAHPWSENALREELGKGIFLVAMHGDTVCGYIGCQTVLDEGYITNVAVLPAWRRKGIAQSLLTALDARAAMLSFITLEVRESNVGALALYRNMGYEVVGRRKNFYTAPVEDAVLMTKYKKTVKL